MPPSVHHAAAHPAALGATQPLLLPSPAELVSVRTAGGEFSYVSAASARLLGCSPAEMIGTTALDYTHPDDADACTAAQVRFRRDGRGVGIHRVRRRDGRYVWLESTSTPIHDAGTGELREIITSSRDVTERITADQELTTVRNAPNGLAVATA